LRATERYVHASDARFDRAREALDARVTQGSMKPRRSGRATGLFLQVSGMGDTGIEPVTAAGCATGSDLAGRPLTRGFVKQ